MKSKVIAQWQGSFKEGLGSYAQEESALSEVNFKHTRSTNYKTATDPEELLCAALASCYTMTLAYILAEEGHQAAILKTSVEIPIKNFLVSRADIFVSASIAGVDRDGFEIFANKAKALCTVGNALNVEIGLTVDYQLG